MVDSYGDLFKYFVAMETDHSFSKAASYFVTKLPLLKHISKFIELRVLWSGLIRSV